jgi:hypothetical protein
MEAKDIIKKYERELVKLQISLELSQKYNSYFQCTKTQIEIDMIKQFLETLKQ